MTKLQERDLASEKLAMSATNSWHTLAWEKVVEALRSTARGLTEKEAEARLAKTGPNELPRGRAPSGWAIFVRQFKSPLIYILGIAASVSVALGETTDAAFILAVLTLNAAVGGFQEWRAEQSAQALQKLLKIRATVERDGEMRTIDAIHVVPGDVIWVESGDRVPADARLIEARGLDIDESLLTGESVAVNKDAVWTGSNDTSLADRRNMIYAGSIVVRGRGRAVVVATGKQTHVGQLAVDVMQASAGKPPLLTRMEKFSRSIGFAVLVAAVLVALIGIYAHGQNPAQMFLVGVALAVAAIPEGLPVALTVALAIGTKRMAKRGVIVRRLAAVEGLGSCTFIGSDKTGTLTCNELTVREIRLPTGEIFQVTGEGYTPEGEVRTTNSAASIDKSESLRSLAHAAVFCNEGDLHQRDGAWIWRGDPTDIALISLGRKLGFKRHALLEQHEEINRIPFESEHRFAASYHKDGDDTLVFVKGAPERVFEMCNLNSDGLSKQTLMETMREMGNNGYRVLALASGRITQGNSVSELPSTPTGLTFLGFVGMIDPLRPGVKGAVEACHNAGIAVAMITGDHPVTALAIARELGLAKLPDQVITGAELEGKSPEQLKDIVGKIRVFARIAPRQKLEIVQALQKAGHFVAVTGDGVNDAPALRKANIGAAMGKAGTDVAREAAELVISDDNFATVVAGVEEGRVAYDNIRKVIYLLVSTGAAEVVLVALAVGFGTPLPLLPVQLLWLNLVTNGIQDVALAFEPGEGDVLNRKPRPPSERVFNRLMIERTVVGAAVMGLVAFGVFLWCLDAGWSESSARNAVLLLMVLFENIHIGNCRSETKSAFKLSPFRNPFLLTGAIAAFLLHVTMMVTPFGQSILSTEPVSLKTGLILFGSALTIFAAIETDKWIRWWRTKA